MQFQFMIGGGPPLLDLPESSAFVQSIEFVKEQILRREEGQRPIFIGISGPQGSGKSVLANLLQIYFEEQNHILPPGHAITDHRKVCVVSLDDFYHKHSTLKNLALAHPDNALLAGRGLPGTHDLELMKRIFHELKTINEPTGTRQRRRTVEVPVYDKSLHGGLGDRSPHPHRIWAPVDVVIVEGWMTGFYPLPEAELKQRYLDAATASSSKSQARPYFAKHPLDHLLLVNALLRGYSTQIWPHLDAMIHLVPEDLRYTFDWRKQQEHSIAAGRGRMTDDQIKTFVARYMPAYELFGEGVTKGDGKTSPRWSSRLLQLTINRQREVIRVHRTEVESAATTAMTDAEAEYDATMLSTPA